MRPLERIVGKKSFIQPDWWSRPDWQVGWTPFSGDVEEVDRDFAGYIHSVYKRDGVVFACIEARRRVFSEARFQFRRFEKGRPTDLFGDRSLSLLERPWPNGTTGELLSRMEQDVSLAGNFYATIVGTGADRRIRRLRPDWVTIVTTSPTDDPSDINAEVGGYLYDPLRWKGSKPDPILLDRSEVVHWSPIPDPDAQWMGMSWLTPILDEIAGDKAATRHKLKFFENGAVPGMVISYDKTMNPEQVKQYAEIINLKFGGGDNAYKTMHLGGGADATPVGANLQQIDFKSVQGGGETRIASSAGVPPVIVGLSEGLQGSSLNTGNFGAARRLFADGFLRPQWRTAAAALETIVEPPAGAELWYDARDVPFLREDAKEEADIRSKDAQTMATLIQAGYTPESVGAAMAAGNFSSLVHTGLYSIQLQPLGGSADLPSPDSGEAA